MFCVKKLFLLIDMSERLSTCLCPLFEVDISKNLKKVYAIDDIYQLKNVLFNYDPDLFLRPTILSKVKNLEMKTHFCCTTIRQ